MTTWMIGKLAIRLVVFGLVFWLVARRHDRVHVTRRWAYPIVALGFAALNASLYWLLKNILVFASLWTLTLVAPLIANALLLWAMMWLFRKLRFEPLKVDGLLPLTYLAVWLTGAHVGLYLVLDVIVG